MHKNCNNTFQSLPTFWVAKQSKYCDELTLTFTGSAVTYSRVLYVLEIHIIHRENLISFLQSCSVGVWIWDYLTPQKTKYYLLPQYIGLSKTK